MEALDVASWHREQKYNRVVEMLQSHSYEVLKADDLKQAKTLVLDELPEGCSVAMGGSTTLLQMDMIETVRQGPWDFFDRFSGKPWPETVEIMRQALLADVMITSVNAITMNGELVNMDSGGNRAASFLFGPKKVVVVASLNKVVNDFDAARKRIREIAPMNARRIKHKTPCAVSGICEDCTTRDSICNFLSVVSTGKKFQGRIKIILVKEDAGY